MRCINLSVIIPARNEEYLGKTIENILANARGEIEVLAILDGWAPEPQLKFDDRVIFIHFKEAIGQRQCINEGAKRARGRFLMKLDAHCAVDEGFDVKLSADCEYKWTIVPRMYNLDIKTFKPKYHKKTDYMYFSGLGSDKPFRARYYSGGEYRRQHSSKKDIDDIMCCMGPGWFMHTSRFWELGGMDEGHGGWGQMGIELACKAWLSGGALKVNKKTWFAHWFRGGGGPGFPYKISGKDQDKARKYSQDLWLNDKWSNAMYKIEWLVKKFDPPGWTNDMTIVFYTANKVNSKIAEPVIRSLRRHGYPIVSVSQEPMDLGKNIVVDKEVSMWNIYKQVLLGAKEAKTKYVALCEDDCLYLKEHFKYRPKKTPFAYNLNRWLLHLEDNVYTYRERPILSQCIADREMLIKNLEERMDGREIPRKYCGEMGVFDKKLKMKEYGYETFKTSQPNMVVCHKNNTERSRKFWGKDAEPTSNLPVWGESKYWTKKMGGKVKSKPFKQHCHIKNLVLDMEPLISNMIDYRDERRPLERAVVRMKAMPPFIKRILAGEEFDNDKLVGLEYYKALRMTHKTGHRKSLRLMKDMIRVALDIQKNGVRNPIDLWQSKGRLVIHRGWRRILIMHQLGYKKVPCRVFKSREYFIKLAPYRFYSPDNSINGLAMQQYMKLEDKATDKYWVHQYTPIYDAHFSSIRKEPLKLLEIGILRGASLALWEQAFPKAEIYGIDITDKWKELTPNKAIVFKGSQEDEVFLKETVVPNGKYDIIIDDGGHKPAQMQKSFSILWDSISEDGWYVIEDLYGNYKGSNRKSTTMNMLKDLIDKMNIEATIKSMHFYYNICFIQKGVNI